MVMLYVATFLSCVLIGPVNVSLVLYYMQQHTPVLDVAHAATFTMAVSQWKTLVLPLNIIAVFLLCIPIAALYRHRLVSTKLVVGNLLSAVMFLGISLTTEKDTTNTNKALAGSHVGTSVIGLCALCYVFWTWARADDDTRRYGHVDTCQCGHHNAWQPVPGASVIVDTYTTVVWSLTYLYTVDAVAFICTIISYAALFNQPQKTDVVSVVLAYTEYVALLLVSLLYLLCICRSLGHISSG
jgi:hypothetical protein